MKFSEVQVGMRVAVMNLDGTLSGFAIVTGFLGGSIVEYRRDENTWLQTIGAVYLRRIRKVKKKPSPESKR